MLVVHWCKTRRDNLKIVDTRNSLFSVCFSADFILLMYTYINTVPLVAFKGNCYIIALHDFSQVISVTVHVPLAGFKSSDTYLKKNSKYLESVLSVIKN